MRSEYNPVLNESTPDQTFPPRLLRLILTSSIALLAIAAALYQQHVQLRSLSQSTLSIQTDLIANNSAFQKHVNRTLSTFQLSLEILTRQIQAVQDAHTLALANTKEEIGRQTQDLERAIMETDQAVRAIEADKLEQEFLMRREEMEKAIEGINETSIGADWQRHVDRLRLSLNNIDNPLRNRTDRQNHTLLMAHLLSEEESSYIGQFHIDTYPHEISICVVVPTRNNAHNHRYLYNLVSILNQNYHNYRVFIADDASEDGTGLLIQRELRRREVPEDRVTVIRRQKRMGSLANIDDVIRTHCRDFTVVATIDGDDQLIGQQVFRLFNAIYQSKSSGLVYSNHVYYLQDQQTVWRGYSQPYSKLSHHKQNYRKVPQYFGHLRSFLTELYLSINEQDLRDHDGKFFMVSGDEAFMLPILEMSCGNIVFVDQLAYLYNAGTGSNVHSLYHEEQEKNAIYIRLLERYPCHPRFRTP